MVVACRRKYWSGLKFLQGIPLFLTVAPLRAHIVYIVSGRPGPGLACLWVWRDLGFFGSWMDHAEGRIGVG